MAYNEDQPRAPAGQPIGGQWVDNRALFDRPGGDLLNRSRAIFQQFTDGPIAKYIHNQSRGSSSASGSPMTPAQKLANLRKIKSWLDEIRNSDPEAYDWSIKSSIADVYGGVGSGTNWYDVPDEVSLYRGDNRDTPLPSMANFTFHRDIAEQFGFVTEYRVNKNDIGFANWSSPFSSEGEVFVFNTKKLRALDPVESAARRAAGLR